jgi:hypothetical protein
MADHYKWLATNNAAYIGAKSAQSELWAVLRCISDFRLSISLFLSLAISASLGLFVGAIFITTHIYAFIFHLDIAQMGLHKLIERIKAKPAEQNDTKLAELTALQDEATWKASNNALHLIVDVLLSLLFACSVPDTLLLIGASLFATKHIRTAVCDFKRWYQRHAELHTKAAKIDTEWVAFGAWMHKNNIPRQSPAELFTTYQRWVESKALAKVEVPATPAAQ